MGEDGSALVSKENPAIAGDIAAADMIELAFKVMLEGCGKSSSDEGVVMAVNMSEGAVEVESLSAE